MRAGRAITSNSCMAWGEFRIEHASLFCLHNHNLSVFWEPQGVWICTATCLAPAAVSDMWSSTSVTMGTYCKATAAGLIRCKDCCTLLSWDSRITCDTPCWHYKQLLIGSSHLTPDLSSHRTDLLQGSNSWHAKSKTLCMFVDSLASGDR